MDLDVCWFSIFQKVVCRKLSKCSLKLNSASILILGGGDDTSVDRDFQKLWALAPVTAFFTHASYIVYRIFITRDKQRDSNQSSGTVEK